MRIQSINTSYRAYSQKATAVESFKGGKHSQTDKLVQGLRGLYDIAPTLAQLDETRREEFTNKFFADHDIRATSSKEDIKAMIEHIIIEENAKQIALANAPQSVLDRMLKK